MGHYRMNVYGLGLLEPNYKISMDQKSGSLTAIAGVDGAWWWQHLSQSSGGSGGNMQRKNHLRGTGNGEW